MSCSRATLALGGGGARGVAHLGVIEGLLDAGFNIERIVGVSIGSLVGALYAFDPSIRRVQERTLGYLLSPEFQRHQRHLHGAQPSPGMQTTGPVFMWWRRVSDYLRVNLVCHNVMRKRSLLPGSLLQEAVDHLLPDADIADAAIPLSIVAVDLLTGQQIVLEKGPLREAVRASASVPGIFPPVKLDGMLLCDIGVFNSLPTTVTRTYATKCLVAVDVSSRLKRLSRCDTAVDVLMRMDEIGENHFRQHVCATADLVISPEVSDVAWFDFSLSRQLIEAGRAATRQAVPALTATCCAS